MNSYGKVIYHLLSNDASVTTLVGADDQSIPKVYPVTMPERVMAPAVVYTKQINARDVKGDPFKNTTCEVSVYAMHKDLDRCEELIAACESAMTVDGNGVIEGTRVLSLRWIVRDDEIYDDVRDIYVIRSRFFLMTHNNL